MIREGYRHDRLVAGIADSFLLICVVETAVICNLSLLIFP